MTLKLSSSGGGSVAIDAPSTSSDRTLTCPDASGTIALTANNLFSSYAVICDKKAYDADGGTFTAGSWQKRDLNHEIRDSGGIVSISSDQFTLGAGNYLIKWSAPAENVNRHTTRLYNATDASAVLSGSSAFLSDGISTEVTGRSFGAAYVSIDGSKAFEIQHYGQTTSSTMGFGMKSNISGADSIYTIVEFYKEA